ncbi:MAG: DUF1841 family protein [Hydrogenophilaceae bacterium]|nr:DUF1841 family protein [Hydrogenophilaceae bacterium]
MFNPSRDQVRQFFFGVWGKYRNKQPLEGAETLALAVILDHPEYHGVLENPDRHQDRDYLPEHGETNPFLHLSMHLALAEQVSIDQPPGIRDLLDQLSTKLGERMAAEHAAIDCLAEMIWQAQRQGTAYDAGIYFECLRKALLT